MIHKLFILISFMLLSGIIFGQDTINKFRRLELPPVQGVPGGKHAIRQNIYVLNNKKKTPFGCR